MIKTKTTLMIVAASSLLMACSSGDVLVFDTRLGPVTEQQVAALPSGLVGDTQNAQRASYTLEGKGMKSPDGK